MPCTDFDDRSHNSKRFLFFKNKKEELFLSILPLDVALKERNSQQEKILKERDLC
jgi:hypothetical protein